MELAVNDSNNEQNQDRDNCNRYNPIGGHPEAVLISPCTIMNGGWQECIPTSHPSQRLHTTIDVAKH